MGFVLAVIGLVLIVTAAKDTYTDFGKEIASDFTGPGNFTYWFAAIGAVGALGYVKSFEKFSRAFMFLIVLAMLLSNQGFFAKLQQALQQGPQRTAKADPVSSTDPEPERVKVEKDEGSQSSSFDAGDVAKIAMMLA